MSKWYVDLKIYVDREIQNRAYAQKGLIGLTHERGGREGESVVAHGDAEPLEEHVYGADGDLTRAEDVQESGVLAVELLGGLKHLRLVLSLEKIQRKLKRV